MWKVSIGFVLVACLSACGNDGGATPPTTPSPSLASLSLTPATDLVKIRSTETFVLNASFSDGASRVVEATWGTDAPTAATVSAGRVTGVGAGQATIFADYQGQRATRLLRVVPDYHGRWSGEHVQTGCRDEGDFRGLCAELADDGRYSMSLTLTQTRDSVAGTADFGGSGPVTGSIDMGGRLALEGRFVVPIEDFPLEVTLSNWETVTTDNERMTGRFALVFRAAGINGSVRLDTELRTVSKTSATPVVGAHESSLRGLIDALRTGRIRARR